MIIKAIKHTTMNYPGVITNVVLLPAVVYQHYSDGRKCIMFSWADWVLIISTLGCLDVDIELKFRVK